MEAGAAHLRHIATTVVGLLTVGIAGCWEEIVYTGPEPRSVARHESTAASPAEVQPPAPDADVVAPVEPAERATTPAVEFAEEAAEPADDFPFDDFEEAEPAPLAEIPAPQVVEAEDESESLFGPLDEPAPAADARATRYAAWQLGSKLSLAALAHERGLVPEKVQEWFREARTAAELLGTSLDELPAHPPRTETEAASHGIHDYIYRQGQKAWRDLSDRHGADHAALLEVAVKSNVLQVLYAPGSADTDALAKAIAEGGVQANLPQELWQPLLDAIARQAPDAEVRAAVRKLHADVEQHLAAAKEQSL